MQGDACVGHLKRSSNPTTRRGRARKPENHTHKTDPVRVPYSVALESIVELSRTEAGSKSFVESNAAAKCGFPFLGLTGEGGACLVRGSGRLEE